MAHFVDPLTTGTTDNLARLERRTTDDLPDRVKGKVHWRIDHSAGPGYYVLNPRNKTYYPVEFINNYWYKLRVYAGIAYSSQVSCIEPHRNDTGYWKPTDYQHPDHRQLVQQAVKGIPEAAYRKDPVFIKTQEEEARERQKHFPRLVTLTVNTSGASSLAADPTISPFVAATPPVASPSVAATATSSPAFTVPHASPGPEESDTETPSSSTTDEPSPDQPGQEEPALVEQLEDLDIPEEPSPEEAAHPEEEFPEEP